jgi:hypothetical protein
VSLFHPGTSDSQDAGTSLLGNCGQVFDSIQVTRTLVCKSHPQRPPSHLLLPTKHTGSQGGGSKICGPNGAVTCTKMQSPLIPVNLSVPTSRGCQAVRFFSKVKTDGNDKL